MNDADRLRYKKISLNNGADEIPALGFGTLISNPNATKEAVELALAAGFRELFPYISVELLPLPHLENSTNPKVE